MRSLLFLASFALAVITVSSATDRKYVVGGHLASKGQFPFYVSIPIQDPKGVSYCGGAILNEKWIITAAHCSYGNEPSKIRIFADNLSYNKGTVYAVEEIVNHESYVGKSKYHNDIGLLRVKGEIDFSSGARPINIRSDPVTVGEEAIAIGSGVTSMIIKSMSKDIKYLELNTISNTECVEQMIPKRKDSIYEDSLCAVAGDKQGVCLGDSGGPLVVDGELVGITAWGIPCGKNYPDVFTRTSEYVSWVLEKMEML